jgi:uncharacterized protein (TIGR04255 family)
MGARIRHLSRAPITEAIVDFRVQCTEGFSASSFDGVRGKVIRDYPNVRPLQSIEAQMGIQGGQLVAPPPSQREAGLIFFSSDERTATQFRVDGFSFNKLPPYTRWEEIYPETMRLWDLYRSAAKPVQVRRVGVRYINRIDVPSTDFSRHLTALPQIPPELPQVTRSFLSRVVLYDARRDVSASLTQASETTVQNLAVTVLLDIDAFKEDPAGDNIEQVLEALHALKNEMFFGSITEETARIYE